MYTPGDTLPSLLNKIEKKNPVKNTDRDIKIAQHKKVLIDGQK